MTAIVTNFALIGDSFPSDKFEALRRASAAALAERRTRRPTHGSRIWSVAHSSIVIPKQLSA